jgi:hypothetical protein
MRRGHFEVVGGLRVEVGWVGVEYEKRRISGVRAY